MNEIKIYLKPSGSTAELYKDFNLYQDSYRNIQISIYVPTVILYKNEDNTFLNTVQTGAILTLPNGAKVPTKGFNAAFVKTTVKDNIEYAEYTQIMPKEFAVYAGTQTIVCNVVNIDNTNTASPAILSVVTSQRVQLIVLESAYLLDEEPLTPPEAEVIEGLINDLQGRLDEGTYAARAIYPWKLNYTYGKDEFVFYPDRGEYGVFLKSLTGNNTNAPYVNGKLDTKNWQLISDFNILTELYPLKEDIQNILSQADEFVETAVTAAANSASSAEDAASSAAEAAEVLSQTKDDVAGMLSQAKEETDNILTTARGEAEELLTKTQAEVEKAQQSAENAAASETAAKDYANIAAAAASDGLKKVIVNNLPETGLDNYLYLVPAYSTADGNYYDEYLWVTDEGTGTAKFEKIGTTLTDLENYVKKSGDEMSGTLSVPTLKATKINVDKIARNDASSIVIEPNVTFNSTLSAPKISVDKISRNAETELYIEPSTRFHSGATFEGSVVVQGKISTDTITAIGNYLGCNATLDMNEHSIQGVNNLTSTGKITAQKLDVAFIETSVPDTAGIMVDSSLVFNSLKGHDITGVDHIVSNHYRAKYAYLHNDNGESGVYFNSAGAINADSAKIYVANDQGPIFQHLYLQAKSGSNVYVNSPLYENGKRVYSPNNPPPLPSLKVSVTVPSNIYAVSFIKPDGTPDYVDGSTGTIEVAPGSPIQVYLNTNITVTCSANFLPDTGFATPLMANERLSSASDAALIYRAQNVPRNATVNLLYLAVGYGITFFATSNLQVTITQRG